MNRSFSDLLLRAITGDMAAVEEILEMYAPLIDHHSRINGYIDEDCRQYILMRVVAGISKFSI
jgi:hypothetical protein